MIPLDTKIEDMDFEVSPWGKRMSTRIKNALLRGGVLTLGDLLDRHWSEMPNGISVIGRSIIETKLESLGLRLKGRMRI